MLGTISLIQQDEKYMSAFEDFFNFLEFEISTLKF